MLKITKNQLYFIYFSFQRLISFPSHIFFNWRGNFNLLFPLIDPHSNKIILFLPEIKTPNKIILFLPEIQTPNKIILFLPEIQTPNKIILFLPEIQTPKKNILFLPEIQTPNNNIGRKVGKKSFSWNPYFLKVRCLYPKLMSWQANGIVLNQGKREIC